MNHNIHNHHHEQHADEEEHIDDTGEDEEHDSDDDGTDQDTDTEENSDDDNSDDEDSDDDSDDDFSIEYIPTPEEVELEYTYPRDFVNRRWQDVVRRHAVTRRHHYFRGQYHFFRLIIDPSCTKIFREAFYFCYSLIEIVFAENSYLTEIGQRAFARCGNLTRMNAFPLGLLRLRREAFDRCFWLLGDLVIPRKVLLVEKACFQSCAALTSVIFQPSSTTAAVVLGKNAFCGCREMRSVRLPPSLLEIPKHCFSGCYALTDIPISKLVRAIRKMAFYNCANLRSMDLSKNNNLEEVGTKAFWYCKSLTRIIIRSTSSNLRFGDNVFDNCPLLSTIKVYPWQFPKIFAAMQHDPSFIYKFFHKYHHQIFEEEAEIGVVTRQHRNGRRRRRQRYQHQKRQRQHG